MPSLVSNEAIEDVRAFNRFYTQRIGVLQPYLDSDLSLTEVRVLYELAQRRPQDAPWTAAGLCAALGLDAGYMSRILRRFHNSDWLLRERSATDARQQHIALSSAGRKAFAPLQKRSQQEAAAMLAALTPPSRQRVLQAMGSLQAELGQAAPRAATVVLRDPQPGDMGWVVQQHGEIYWREYRWNNEFEALAAGIAAQFVKRFQPEWERCWIAELDGERVGAVFVVRKSKTTAQLRMLIVAPAARGLGLGARLTDECIAFARERSGPGGYKKMVLWTNSCLTAARAIYAKRGFRLTRSEAHHSFGHDMVGENWELRL
jgi:DNA-binding MarR family transcriptional regulator/N-acetylglutamate synthase-like GNAT family acetyltransferase